MAVILITHDLGVVAEIADRVLVMYAGRIVEDGTLDEIFYDPQHPYTWGLLGSLARLDRPRPHRLAQIQGQPPSLLAPPAGLPLPPPLPARVRALHRGAGSSRFEPVRRATSTVAGSPPSASGPARRRGRRHRAGGPAA